MSRYFTGTSTIERDAVAFALAPALTPDGVVAAPSFFHGFATQPQVLARGLVTLADITATRYFQYVPSELRDPVLTAQGDRLRAECFSACNSVYARLDLLPDAFDGGEIRHGTTNVDISAATRAMLSSVARNELLHLDVGIEGVTASTPTASATERPVEMPDRWVRALGNAAELHHGLSEGFTVGAPGAKAFIAGLPPATSKAVTGWLVPTRAGVRFANRPATGAVAISGVHRLSALKRLLVHVTGLTVRGPGGGAAGPVLVTVHLPAARLTLGLTEESWRGYSGEGALLSALASAEVLDDADLLSALLAFEPVIDVSRLASGADLSPGRVRGGLAVLATSGRVGWDAHDGAWFHRELPDDPDRVDKDNPRLVAARRLADAGAVRADGTRWVVRSSGTDYTVEFAPDRTPRCTCTWYLRHQSRRGACKHALAVQLFTQEPV
ncbi:hypothetical protein [Propionicicella superfundia]|uniref:hypothetical protein n=1 Tax=Propionicicella superfundia TaxID=348582 RepID=UPI000418C8F8|nr:hypothetical protein [Propionicicella superfundia]